MQSIPATARHLRRPDAVRAVHAQNFSLYATSSCMETLRVLKVCEKDMWVAVAQLHVTKLRVKKTYHVWKSRVWRSCLWKVLCMTIWRYNDMCGRITRVTTLYMKGLYPWQRVCDNVVTGWVAFGFTKMWMKGWTSGKRLCMVVPSTATHEARTSGYMTCRRRAGCATSLDGGVFILYML